MNKDYEDKPCIFCGEMCRHTRDGSNARDYYTCKNHGQYCITDDFTHLGTEREKSVVSGYLFETKDRAEPIILLDNEISKIRNNSLVPKTSMQKLNKIMLYAYSLNQGFSTSFDVLPPYVGYAQNKLEMVDMLLALIELGYIFYKDNLYRISIKLYMSF